METDQIPNDQKVVLFEKRRALELNLFELDAAVRYEHLVAIEAIKANMGKCGIREDEYDEYLSTSSIPH